MRSFIVSLTAAAVVALGALSGPVEACEAVGQFRSAYCAPALTAAFYQPPVAQFVAPPAPSYYVQQQAFVAPPQPVVAAYSQSYTARPVALNAGYSQAFAVGSPVAVRGRFAGSPAVGGAAQLNLGGGTSRERVLRPTLFKRKVASPVVDVGVVGQLQAVPY